MRKSAISLLKQTRVLGESSKKNFEVYNSTPFSRDPNVLYANACTFHTSRITRWNGNETVSLPDTQPKHSIRDIFLGLT
ncbi:10675_t:CDS:1, partial [Paraglomus occultum]